jgi:hypothetical protein
MPEPSCPGLASARAADKVDLGSKSLRTPFLPPGSPPLFHYENGVEWPFDTHFKHRKRLQRGAACASGSGVEQPCRRKSGAPQLYQARQHVADCRSNEAQASSRGGVTCR